MAPNNQRTRFDELRDAFAVFLKCSAEERQSAIPPTRQKSFSGAVRTLNLWRDCDPQESPETILAIVEFVASLYAQLGLSKRARRALEVGQFMTHAVNSASDLDDGIKIALEMARVQISGAQAARLRITRKTLLDDFRGSAKDAAADRVGALFGVSAKTIYTWQRVRRSGKTVAPETSRAELVLEALLLLLGDPAAAKKVTRFILENGL